MSIHQRIQPAVVVGVDLTLETPQRLLLEKVSLSLGSGRRVALVGRNGSGKSSLLATIDARFGAPWPAHVRITNGTLHVAAGASCVRVAQHPRRQDDDRPAVDFVDACGGASAATHRRYVALSGNAPRLTTPEGVRELGELTHAMDALNAWDYPERRDEVVRGLGVGSEALTRKLATLSGGEVTKLALAGALLAAPDLLLLDEPTNNLDDDALRFLSSWLRNSDAAMLIVSHDRAFLDEVIDEILEIGEFAPTLVAFGGTYSAFAEHKRVEFAAAVRQYDEQVARRDALLRSAGGLSSSAQRFQATSSNDFYRARGKKVARRATVQLARVERELSSLEEPSMPRRPRIDVPAVDSGHGRALAASGVTVRFDDRTVLTSLSMTLWRGERVAVAGPNGSGKTTLLRTLLGELTPDAGSIERTVRLRFAYLPQSVVPPASGERVIDRARRTAMISEDDARALLGKVVFSDVGDQPLAAFSPGERRRMELAVLFATRPDLVVLDEPTNHLDLPTIEMLEEALTAYTGTLLTVSHDRRYLENVGVQRVIRLPA